MTTATSATSSTIPAGTASAATSGILQSMVIGSGLDISSIVTQLTQAEMSAQTANVTAQQTAVTANVSALATLKSALSTFQSSLSVFGGTGSSSAFNSLSATSGDNTVFTATAGAGAVNGTYQVQVNTLAQSQQLISNVFSSGSTSSIGTGTLNLSLGGQGFSVAINSTNNTLAGISNAINTASGNPGITATLIYGTGNNAQLVLSSTQTGAANTISVSSSGGDGGLSALNYNSSNTTNFTQQQAAQDASISVAGVTHTSSSNVISNALDGVTLNLVAAKPNTNVSLTVTNDSSNVSSLMQSFVTAYNTMIQQVTPLGSYDASTQTAGPMLGDPVLTGIQNQLFQAMNNPVASAGTTTNSLASLGINTNSDGTLSLNTSILNSALNSNFQDATDVMGGSDGVISRLNSMLNNALSTTGTIQTRSNTLTDQQNTINDENAAITAQTAVVQQRYMDQFNAMDSFLAQMQNTSSFLTQQFDALNNVNSTNSSSSK